MLNMPQSLNTHIGLGYLVAQFNNLIPECRSLVDGNSWAIWNAFQSSDLKVRKNWKLDGLMREQAMLFGIWLQGVQATGLVRLLGPKSILLISIIGRVFHEFACKRLALSWSLQRG